MADRRIDPWGRRRTTPASRSPEEGNPFFALYREMNRTFGEFVRDLDLPMFSRGGAGGWPHVDVAETDKEVRVIAELPGMDEKDVEVTLDDGLLTLRGEKKSESEGAVHRERWHGTFQRDIQLGPEVDPEKVSASFKNGVLTVILGKREEAQRHVKRIPISGSDEISEGTARTSGGPGELV